MQGAAAEQRQDEELVQGRLSSADLYAMGPATGDRAFAILKERHHRRQETESRRESRREAARLKRSNLQAEYAATFHRICVLSKTDIRALLVHEFKSILYMVDNGNAEMHHKALKTKGLLVDYILELQQYRDLPDGVAVSRALGKRKAMCADSCGEDDESIHGGTDSSWEGDDDDDTENDDMPYQMDHFVAARKNGSSFDLRVRWQGYQSSDDTWEPIYQMRLSQNNLVNQFIASLKSSGAWPPK